MNRTNPIPHLFPLLLILLLLAGCGRTGRTGGAPAPDVLRLHVVANSDSPEDQAVKLRVRDAILALMEPKDSMAEAEAFLLENGALFQSAAEQTLSDQGFSYGARLMLGIYPFPERDYGGTVYPAGNYRALRVVLGEGAGQNWWCVLFPPLCIPAGEQEAADRGAPEFYSSICSWWRNRS